MKQDRNEKVYEEVFEKEAVKPVRDKEAGNTAESGVKIQFNFEELQAKNTGHLCVDSD